MYTLRIHCGEDYPDRCPVVRFVSKLNMGCVDQRSGEVLRNKLAVLAQWNRNYGIEQVRTCFLLRCLPACCLLFYRDMSVCACMRLDRRYKSYAGRAKEESGLLVVCRMSTLV